MHIIYYCKSLSFSLKRTTICKGNGVYDNSFYLNLESRRIVAAAQRENRSGPVKN